MTTSQILSQDRIDALFMSYWHGVRGRLNCFAGRVTRFAFPCLSMGAELCLYRSSLAEDGAGMQNPVALHLTVMNLHFSASACGQVHLNRATTARSVAVPDLFLVRLLEERSRA